MISYSMEAKKDVTRWWSLSLWNTCVRVFLCGCWWVLHKDKFNYSRQESRWIERYVTLSRQICFVLFRSIIHFTHIFKIDCLGHWHTMKTTQSSNNIRIRLNVIAVKTQRFYMTQKNKQWHTRMTFYEQNIWRDANDMKALKWCSACPMERVLVVVSRATVVLRSNHNVVFS